VEITKKLSDGLVLWTSDPFCTFVDVDDNSVGSTSGISILY
jgi:hypothetical protein